MRFHVRQINKERLWCNLKSHSRSILRRAAIGRCTINNNSQSYLLTTIDHVMWRAPIGHVMWRAPIGRFM